MCRNASDCLDQYNTGTPALSLLHSHRAWLRTLHPDLQLRIIYHMIEMEERNAPLGWLVIVMEAYRRLARWL
jgi:hypothetical protein